MTPGPGYLLVIPWSPDAPGGVSQVVTNLHRELGWRGCTPTVLVNDWEAPRPRPDRSGALPLLRWRIRPPWCPGREFRGLVAFLLFFPVFAWRWRRLARQWDWQVVNVHYPGLSTLAFTALKALGLWQGRLILSVHGREVRDTLTGADAVARRLLRLALEQADAVVACSAELATDVLRLAPGTAGHVVVIPNGVDPAALRAKRDPAFRLPAALAGRPYVLNVATFEHKKAQDVLLAAFARLAHRHPELHLVMAGRDTPWIAVVRGILARLAAGNGLASRVHFETDLPHEQVVGLLAGARVFCLPSRAEGHPLALLEAAVLGVPVVATPVGGIPETLADGDHGHLVPVGDAEALAGALDAVLTDPGQAGERARRLQARVEETFTWSRAADRYAELALRAV